MIGSQEFLHPTGCGQAICDQASHFVLFSLHIGKAGDHVVDFVSRNHDDTIAVDRSDPVEKGQVVAKLESAVEQAQVDLSKQRAGFDGEIESKRASLSFARRSVSSVSRSPDSPQSSTWLFASTQQSTCAAMRQPTLSGCMR